MNKQGFKRRRREIFSKLRIVVFLAFIFILPIKPLFAQVFPVQAYINVTPPYSIYLSKYTASDQEKILATILLRDPVITSIDVKFRFTIQGAGIKLTTNPSWLPAPFNLTSGNSVILPQDIIAEYLEPKHLLIEGVDQQEFYRSGKLPEGYYQFKVEVIEYHRNITISNTAQTGLWLMLNEPPRIVFPLPNQKVVATNPQMLNFTWVPGGISSPQSSLTTQYEFTLVELTDSNIDPYIAITTASNATKYVKTLDQTNLFYGPGEMQLIPGQRYAIRVRAYSTEGLDMFKNNGYSDVRVFTFGDACVSPVSFNLQNPKQSSFEVNVVTHPTNTAWQVRFRESTAGSDLQSVPNNSSWSELKSESNSSLKTVKGLKASTSYEVQIKGLCGDIPSDYTQLQTITTSEMVSTNRSCNNSASPFVVKDASVLSQLKVNDTFLAALFPIKVKGIKSQGGGKFSGYGIATLPLFNTGLAVTFDNVGINNLMQLTSGEVKVVRDEFNMTLIGDSQTTTTTTTTGSGTGGPTGGGTYPPIKDTVTIPAIYDSIVVVNNTTILVYTPTGTKTLTVDLGGNSSTLLVPEGGNMDNAKIVYDGAVHPYTPGQGGSGGLATQGKYSGFLANFYPNSRQIYGFDSMKFTQYTSYYQEMLVNGKLVKLPWKALEVGKTDFVDMRIKRSGNTYPYSKLKVGILGGTDLIPNSRTDSTKLTFSLNGVSEGNEEAVVATYQDSSKTKYAGGVWTVTYKMETFKLYIVPLKGIQVTELDKGAIINGLKEIYGKTVVSWSVDTLAGFPGIDLGENGLDWAESEMLSSYDEEMNNLISAFKDWKTNPDPDGYYLFVVPKFSESGVEGFMPRNRRFGFVTQAQLKDRTVAHELGHGAFNLRHTFPEVTQATTDNLMDYAEGYALYKPQWDLIHNPEATTGLWDGMEEGAAITLSNLIKTIREANLKELQSLPIVKDKCEKKAFGNFAIGDKKLTYIHLLCGDLQKTDIFPYNIDATTQFSLQSLLNSSSININPSEIDKEVVTGTKDGLKYVIYRFHEIKINQAPLSQSYTDNVLFHIMVRKDESEGFEDYIYPRVKILLSNVEWVDQTSSSIQDIVGKNGYDNCTYCSSWTTCSGSVRTCCNNCCWVTCNYIVKQSGGNPSKTDRINISELVIKDDISSGLHSTNFIAGKNIIESNLKKGLPVVVGVNNSKKTDIYNTFNAATHHFLVIIGKGFDKTEGKEFYYYHEVGFNEKNICDGRIENTNNKLYIDEVGQIINGERAYGGAGTIYTVTEVLNNN